MLANSACRGAFQLNDEGLVALKGSDPAVSEDAQRTKDLWSSLASFVPDLGTVIAKRETGMSVASRKGGVILEASAPLNIGILRASLRNEAPITLENSDLSAFAAAGTKALWNLANWIEGIETGRAMRIQVGDDMFKMWARKGKFGLAPSVTPGDVATIVLSANQTGAEVSLSYDELTKDTPPPEYDPIALFQTATSDNEDWQFDSLGVPLMRPSDASLQMTGRMLSLHAHLLSWGAGQPFEVTILRDNGKPEIIAQSNAAAQIRVSLNSLIS